MLGDLGQVTHRGGGDCRGMRNDAIRTLAENWAPPVAAAFGEVGRPLACVASTYTFHAPFLESELLPRFLGLKFDETEGVRPVRGRAGAGACHGTRLRACRR